MNFVEDQEKTLAVKLIIKKCYICGHISESSKEPKECLNCQKSFLPLNYFNKIHAQDGSGFTELFSVSQEIHEEDLIKGLMVLW